VTINGRDWLVAYNTFDTVLGGVGASDMRAVITGNLARNVTKFGFSASGDTPGADDVVITDNQVEVTSGSTMRWGIAVISGGRNIVVANNVIRLNSAASGLSTIGIQLQGPTDGALIQGNSLWLNGTGVLTSGHSLIGINGFDNGQGFNAVVSNNMVKLVNESTYYTGGIVIKAAAAPDNVVVILSGNVMRGFSRANTAYAYDVLRTNGTLRYTFLSNLMDGGFLRHGTTNITDGSTDNVPINLNAVVP